MFMVDGEDLPGPVYRSLIRARMQPGLDVALGTFDLEGRAGTALRVGEIVSGNDLF
jgi:hypothetical protein